MDDTKRHRLIAESIAATVILSVVLFVGLVIVGAFGATFAGVGATWFGLYAFIVLMSATKLYGTGIYEAVKGMGKGLLSQQQQPRLQQQRDSNE
jgi:fatty-acid desaturase